MLHPYRTFLQYAFCIAFAHCKGINLRSSVIFFHSLLLHTLHRTSFWKKKFNGVLYFKFHHINSRKTQFNSIEFSTFVIYSVRLLFDDLFCVVTFWKKWAKCCVKWSSFLMWNTYDTDCACVQPKPKRSLLTVLCELLHLRLSSEQNVFFDLETVFDRNDDQKR